MNNSNVDIGLLICQRRCREVDIGVMTYCKIAIAGFLPRQQQSLSIQLKNSTKLARPISLAKALFERPIKPTKHRKELYRDAVKIGLDRPNGGEPTSTAHGLALIDQAPDMGGWSPPEEEQS